MNKDILKKSKWKNKNTQYLFELQKFLDLTDNIKEKELRELIVCQMIKCDNCITRLAEEIFETLEKG